MLIVLSLLIFGLSKAQTLSAQDWQSAEDFKKDEVLVKENIIWLENNPLATESNDTKAITEYVLNWLANVPYLSVKYDEVFLTGLTNSKKYKFGEKFRVTYLFGKAYYMLEEADNENEANACARGIMGMVSVYNELKKADPLVRNRLLEKYSRLVKNKKIESYARTILDKTST